MHNGTQAQDPDSSPLQYRVSTRLAGIVAAVLHRGLVVKGLENLPLRGGVILASNHISVLDPPVLGIAVSRVRFPHYLAKQELFQVPPFGAILKSWGSIPLDRGRGDAGAIRAVLGVLAAGGCMVIFPEGTRKKPGRETRAKPGVGFLARESGVPVVPVRVRNTERIVGLRPYQVTLGRPTLYEGGEGREHYQAFADRVLEMICSL